MNLHYLLWANGVICENCCEEYYDYRKVTILSKIDTKQIIFFLKKSAIFLIMSCVVVVDEIATTVIEVATILLFFLAKLQ